MYQIITQAYSIHLLTLQHIIYLEAFKYNQTRVIVNTYTGNEVMHWVAMLLLWIEPDHLALIPNMWLTENFRRNDYTNYYNCILSTCKFLVCHTRKNMEHTPVNKDTWDARLASVSRSLLTLRPVRDFSRSRLSSWMMPSGNWNAE